MGNPYASTEDFPTPHNPLGVKGAAYGEGGITAAGAAIAAVQRRIQETIALGVEVNRLRVITAAGATIAAQAWLVKRLPLLELMDQGETGSS